MKHSDHESDANHGLPAAPLTLEGSALLHQFFRLRRAEWNRLENKQRAAITEEASAYFAADRDGHTAIFSELGHKGDLIMVHFRQPSISSTQRKSRSRGLASANSSNRPTLMFPWSKSVFTKPASGSIKT